MSHSPLFAWFHYLKGYYSDHHECYSSVKYKSISLNCWAFSSLLPITKTQRVSKEICNSMQWYHCLFIIFLLFCSENKKNDATKAETIISTSFCAHAPKSWYKYTTSGYRVSNFWSPVVLPGTREVLDKRFQLHERPLDCSRTVVLQQRSLKQCRRFCCPTTVLGGLAHYCVQIWRQFFVGQSVARLGAFFKEKVTQNDCLFGQAQVRHLQ